MVHRMVAGNLMLYTRIIEFLRRRFAVYCGIGHHYCAHHGHDLKPTMKNGPLLQCTTCFHLVDTSPEVVPKWIN